MGRTKHPKYPKIGVIFELTLDGDAPENQPMTMFESNGYITKGWWHNGVVVAGKQTHIFKLFQWKGDWDKIGDKIGDNNPPGQWRNAFLSTFPEPDDKCPIGVHDASWHSLHGRSFPGIDLYGEPTFFRTNQITPFSPWRWLIFAKS